MGRIPGPAAFVTAWIACGLATDGYSPVADPISRLAAIGVRTRVPMTAGFVGFGLGVPAYALALRRSLAGPAWVAAAATGLATLGVGAFPLDSSATVDSVHGAFAGLGYATLAATPILASRSLATSGRRRLAAASLATGVVCAA